MAISSKGMRKITVNGEVFLWKIRHKMSHEEDHNDQYAIPVQHPSGGQLLFVFVGFSRAWGGYINNSPESVTPKMIQPLIEEAMKLGWKFNEPGKPIALVNGVLETDTRRAKWTRLNPDIMSAADFFKEYAAGRRVFCNQQFDEPEAFKYQDFRECIFDQCDFNADFAGANLRNVSFYCCDLKSSKFTDCDLTDAAIRLCTVDFVKFSGAKTGGFKCYYNYYFKTPVNETEFEEIFKNSSIDPFNSY